MHFDFNHNNNFCIYDPHYNWLHSVNIRGYEKHGTGRCGVVGKAYVQQWTFFGSYDDDDCFSTSCVIIILGFAMASDKFLRTQAQKAEADH